MSTKRAGRILAVCLGLLALGLVGGLALSGSLGYQATPIESERANVSAGIGQPWFGAVHVHTKLSGDASGTVERIAAAAGRAGLDFIVIADHTRSEGAAGRAEEGWYGDVLVVVAEEISTDAGHLLALNGRPHRYALGPTARQALADIVELGGRPIIAHPSGGELAWRARWTGAVGVEVVSYSDVLARSPWPRRLGGFVAYPVSPEAAALRWFTTQSPALAQWDRTTRLTDNRLPRPLAALGAVDAHGPVGWFGAPGYEPLFRSLSMIVWMDAPPAPGEDGRKAASRLAERLARGQSAIVLSAAGGVPGFRFTAEYSGRRTAVPGQLVRWRSGWTLHAAMGAMGPYRLVLLRDGEPIASAVGADLEHVATEPGTYRVEAYRTAGPAGGGREGTTPWVVSNPIYLWPQTVIAASRLQLAPVPPAPPIDADLMLEPGWAAESDPTSRSSLALAEDGLRWSLRMPRAGAVGAYAAIAWRPERPVNWSRSRGLAVRLRSTRSWRVSLRVWTLDQQGRQRTWERVVRSDPAARGSGQHWDRFRLLEGEQLTGAHATLSDDLGRVTGVALVATPDRMKPSTETEIEILSIGTFGSDWD